ncbi:MAG: TerC family protein [Pirellulales bacterium]
MFNAALLSGLFAANDPKLPANAAALAEGVPPVELWHWLATSGFVTVLLIFDLVVFHRHSKETTLREAGIATFVWFMLAMAFNAVVFWYFRPPGQALWQSTAGWEFLTGYFVEWSLSMDNVFVFAVIFVHFRVPKKYQYRVLFWGILGAIGLRLTFVLLGARLIQIFEPIMVVFGAFLIYTAIKLVVKEDEFDPETGILFRLGRKFFRIAKDDHGDKFFVREAGSLCVTPLFIVLLVVESTDMLFAVDSVPAIFGVVKSPPPLGTFVIFTSNLFAIMGLRALYFLLAGIMHMFRYLKYGLSAILGFVGVKMILEFAYHHSQTVRDLVPASWKEMASQNDMFLPFLSLSVIVSLLAISIIASLLARESVPATAEAQDSHDKPTEDSP